MKYIISWFERTQGSPLEYENAQKRILDVFGQWKAPENFKIEFFVVRASREPGQGSLGRSVQYPCGCNPRAPASRGNRRLHA